MQLYNTKRNAHYGTGDGASLYIMLHAALRIAAQGKEQAHHARVHPVEGMELSPPSFSTMLHLNPKTIKG